MLIYAAMGSSPLRYINIYPIKVKGKEVVGFGANCESGCWGKWKGKGRAILDYSNNTSIKCKGYKYVAAGEKYGHCHLVNK